MSYNACTGEIAVSHCSSSNLTSQLNPLTTSQKQKLKKMNRSRVRAQTDGQSVPIKQLIRYLINAYFGIETWV